jgi:hypothetical protein
MLNCVPLIALPVGRWTDLVHVVVSQGASQYEGHDDAECKSAARRILRLDPAARRRGAAA